MNEKSAEIVLMPYSRNTARTIIREAWSRTNLFHSLSKWQKQFARKRGKCRIALPSDLVLLFLLDSCVNTTKILLRLVFGLLGRFSGYASNSSVCWMRCCHRCSMFTRNEMIFMSVVLVYRLLSSLGSIFGCWKSNSNSTMLRCLLLILQFNRWMSFKSN